MMQWRLGLDMGTNSLGWWAFELDTRAEIPVVCSSLDGGVYIFSDGREPGKSGRVGDSRAVARRLARGMRRNRDRGINRRTEALRCLVDFGLLPADRQARRHLFDSSRGDTNPDRYNPYRLRAEALERPLSRDELGRVLLHLALRRGFKSGRKERSDEDGGNLREMIGGLREALAGRTLGQFLWHRILEDRKREAQGGKAQGIRFRAGQEFYPDRAMYADEFDAIRRIQEQYHDLNPEDWEAIRERSVLYQRPLKPVEKGACEFLPGEKRHWRDTPEGQDFRMYQELNALRWLDGNMASHPLDREQYIALLDALLTRRSEVKFSSMRGRSFRRADGSPMFPADSRFNLESDRRTGLKPHWIAAEMQGNDMLAPLWQAYASVDGDGGKLGDIFTELHDQADPETLRRKLAEDFGLTGEVAAALMDLKLPTATSSVSRRFMEMVVPVMRDQGLMYHEAVSQLADADGGALHHSHRPAAGDRDNLPYYGEILSGSMMGGNPDASGDSNPEYRFGRIANPTVHVALNALRRVVNSLIERFGPPYEIHVELSRDLKSTREQRDRTVSEQARNEKENKRISKLLETHGIAHATAVDLKKVKLWEELGDDELTRCCPYSGRVISFAQLLNGEAEIEHILPFRRTLDNSMANLTVAMKWANALKGNRTPFEAFSEESGDGKIDWDDIRAAASKLPANKAWRFGPDAMERFEKENDFIARQLTDNAYIARSAMRYLGCLNGVRSIVPNRGGLTALLRGKWGLNGILSDDNMKTREDHRHHAVDAAVIGLADRRVLAEVSRLTGRSADGRIRIDVPDLSPELEDAIRERVSRIVVAYRPDHGWQGGMFKETAYGFIKKDRRDPDLPEHDLVTRKPLLSLTPKEFGQIRDPDIRRAVETCLADAAESGEKPETALARFSRENGINRVRILVKDQTVAPIASAPWKGYKTDAYVCCDVWRCPKGRAGRWRPGEYEWKGVFWSHADCAAGIPDAADRRPHPAARHVCRLFKNDLVAVGGQMDSEILRVAGFSTTNNKLDLVPHNQANAPQTYVSINVIGKRNLRKLHVAPDGRVRGLKGGPRR